MKDIAQWTAPSPLWAAAAGDTADPSRTVFRQPSILRFATDSFMDELMALLESDPSKLADYLAQPETWRGPQVSPPPPPRLTGFELRLERLRLAAERKVLGKAIGSALPVPSGSMALAATKQARAANQLKLYQPAHQRFYLLTACCVCRIAGLPDKMIDAGRQERASFVIRRLIEKQPNGSPNGPKEFDEYGFAVTPQGNVWKKVKVKNGVPVGLVQNEEQLPLFNMNFTETDGRRRRLLGGMIPVGKREAYMGAPLSNANGDTAASGNGATKKTARKILFRTQVTEPWKSLITRSEDVRRKIAGGAASPADTNPDPPMNDGTAKGIAAVAGFLKEAREQMQTVSWLLLLDFADYLKQYLPDVWTSIKTGTNLQTLTQSQLDLLEALRLTVSSPSLVNALIAGQNVYQASNVSANLREALRSMIAFDGEKARDKRSLELVTTAYNRSNPASLYPSFLFPFADPGAGVVAPQIPTLAGVTLHADEDDIEEGTALDNIDKLVGYVVKALPSDSSAPEPPPPLAATRPYVEREGLFIARCVYERPECGPLEPVVLSDGTTSFQMAGFFDPDAPARPIRIALPIDTSPAGLRKHDKNTAFMISDVLCGQIGRFKSLSLGDLVRSVLPWPFHKDLSMSAPDQGACKSGTMEFGMICSLSIPIITICALILLMIIVFLFDLIFKWIPFFILCFPLPKFKAKPSQ
ncbi:MAG TPA: hypothetical protein VIW80_21600 [Pyrinomonadaceae bacterium]